METKIKHPELYRQQHQLQQLQADKFNKVPTP